MAIHLLNITEQEAIILNPPTNNIRFILETQGCLFISAQVNQYQ